MSHKAVKISVITVTYNSAGTVQDTIRSVLDQSYSPCEYIVIDGNSKDETVNIVKSYQSEFDDKGIKLKIVSEPDNGIYDAMNKGIDIADGDVIGIINSDDWYENDALEVVAKAYEESGFDLFYADLRMVRPDGSSFIKHSKYRRYATSRDWNHPTTFITHDIYSKYHYNNDTIHDDYDLILRILKQGIKVVVVNKVIANFRMNGVSHKRSVKAAITRMGIKYKIYRQNGYSPFYFLECFIVEMGKLVIG